jgi:Zn-finger protein
MKFLKIAVAAVLALAGGTAYAFHDGGVASCEGCHVMHNAAGGQAVTVKGGVAIRGNTTNAYLLQGSDQSSTCLICHASSVAGQAFMASNPAPATAPTQYTPGGDFGWLAGTGGAVRKAHNVVAADYAAQGFVADSAMLTAPGGTFTGGSGTKAFACSNCHDPHGRYRLVGTGTAGDVVVVNPSATGSVRPIVASGSYGVQTVNSIVVPNANLAVGVYRILGGAGYAPASNTVYPFPNPPPSAVAPTNYNRADTNASEVRVAYGQGMSEWCQNCHTNIHFGAGNYSTGVAGQRHPSSNGAHLTASIATIYNTYVSSGQFSGTANQYNALVPFESGTTNLATLAAGAATTDNTANPTIFTASGTSNVMCLSCHRAHASGFDSITRWNNSPSGNSAGFLADATAFTSVPGLNNTTQIQAAYYGRQVGSTGTDIRPFQRSLCNKCHGKD